MKRKGFILALIALTILLHSSKAQQFFLDEPLHMSGDTLRGVGYMEDEGLTGYAYFFS